MQKGKLIVIDGTDGTGKATQVALLIKHLRKEKVRVRTVSFPQYQTKSAGLVENYLKGEYGKKPEDVSPYVASLFYAVDRFDAAAKKIRPWLKKGFTVVLDRYVESNMGHQGTKFASAKTRQNFFRWVSDLEYRILDLPQPDLRIIFYIDPVLGKRRAQEKHKTGSKLHVKKDILEKDLQHQKKAAKVYRELASLLPKTYRIDCLQGNKELSRQEIHELVWQHVQRIQKR